MKLGLWSSLEGTGVPARLPVDWQRRVGAELATLGPFLRPSDEVALTYPCVDEMDCGCRHELIQFAEGRWLARCTCDEFGPCPAPRLTAQDLVMHELDAARFGATVARMLGFDAALRIGPVRPASAMWTVGRHAATGAPVVMSFCSGEALWLKELLAAVESLGEPLILLSPTGRAPSEAVIGLVKRERCAVVPLAKSLEPDGPGRFRLATSIAPVLERFRAGLATGDGLVKTVERIDRNIEAVAQDKYNLRKENEELRQLNKDGYFNFAVRVNGEDFLAFAVIMALGNRKAAADHLKVPHRSFYNRVDQWAARGRDYQLMIRYMDWRKRSSRHLKVELNPSLQSGESDDQPENPETMADVLEELKAADHKSYPALFAEVLQALERQNSGNWMAVRTELVDLIKEEALQ